MSDLKTWEWRVIKDEEGYKLVEYFTGLDSWAEIWVADSLETLAQQIIDEFTSQMEAIRRFSEDMPDLPKAT
jgi:hypothetical protein